MLTEERKPPLEALPSRIALGRELVLAPEASGDGEAREGQDELAEEGGEDRVGQLRDEETVEDRQAVHGQGTFEESAQHVLGEKEEGGNEDRWYQNSGGIHSGIGVAETVDEVGEGVGGEGGGKEADVLACEHVGMGHHPGDGLVAERVIDRVQHSQVEQPRQTSATLLLAAVRHEILIVQSGGEVGRPAEGDGGWSVSSCHEGPKKPRPFEEVQRLRTQDSRTLKKLVGIVEGPQIVAISGGGVYVDALDDLPQAGQ